MSRVPRVLAVVLSLVIFLGWLGMGSAHQHPGQPSCPICKALSDGGADLPRPAAVPAPRLAADRITPSAAEAPTPRLLSSHRERAPPSS